MRHAIIRSGLSMTLALLLMSVSGCRTVLREPAPDSVLRVGVTTTYPPIIFRQDGRIAGVEADLARELARALEKQLVWVELKWDELIDSLLDGSIDIIMSGMSVTDARRMRIEFSKPYLETGQMALMRHAHTDRFDSPERVLSTTARIGVVDGTTGDVFVQTKCPKATKISIGAPDDAMVYFAGNRIDLFIHDAPSILLLASRHEAEVAPLWELLTKEQLAWGIRRDDAEFLAAVNRLLDEWRDSGKLHKTLARWIPHSDRLHETP